jgi:ABC-type polysaccharide/polyol phosphate transport system ATPase subunit
MTPVLRFDRVTKTFAHRAGRLLLRERFIDMMRPSSRQRFEALHEVSFELSHGESLGLIGPNGAGKSTLLNLATGLALPDAGSIAVEGRVGALLDLGAGFHPDLTGAENVRVNGALLGLSRRVLEARFEEIVEFSGIGEFINEPLRTYSAGMTLRLAFSVAVCAEPDVLLIDELLAVGDQAFAAQCLEKIRSFQRAGKSIVVASHSIELLTMLCQHALWLDHGRVVALGPAKEVVAAYRSGQVPVS